MKKIEKSIEIGGKTLTLSTGVLAGQADGAVLGQYGETVVLATVVASNLIEDRGYFPLSVEYQERLYAGGRIKGSRWVKREGRPSDDEILKGRLIDRSIRPLFSKEYKGKDVQVVVTVLSVDMENDPIYVAGVAVSAAIAASSIPWKGPVGVVSVGLKDGVYLINPTEVEKASSEMDLVVSGTKSAVVMIEAGAKEVVEAKVLEGVEEAQKEIVKIIDFVEGFAHEVGNKKEVLEKRTKNVELVKAVKKAVSEHLPALIKAAAAGGFGDDYGQLKGAVLDLVAEEERAEAGEIFEDLIKEEVRGMILRGKRPDGRGYDEIRKLSSEVGILPRTHGSAIFNRGETQALSVTTLGSPSLGQLIESAEGEEEKRYIHHYSMPPYSIGETGRFGSPSRREIGHGALAEKALLPVIPAESEFPYAIRVVSEVMSSNGSTSMASTCGSTLSLMDAGVPIKSPVSGIAMGLVVESDKKYVILSDIAGIEDFNGDMDFKIAGTAVGVTAMQLDVKTLSLTAAILEEALKQAKTGREKILESMLMTIAEPRVKVSAYAPKIVVIGPGGKVIRKIIAETGAEVEVEDDGRVNISGMSDEGVVKAREWIETLTREVKPGEIYRGKVKKIQPFGVFVEILHGKEGLVKIGDMSEGFVKSPEDVVKVGDEVEVRVKEIDEMGRINLSMILDPAREKKNISRGRERGRGRPTDRPSGPHFPTSRLLDTKGKKSFGR
jgi:polyribonucleotide nucleotidyltransferase